MAISVTIKPSTDGSNQLTYGSDNGLFVASNETVRGQTPAWTLDNSSSSALIATTYYYALPTWTTSSYTWSTSAQLTPLLFTRNCRVTDATLNVATASAGSFIYVAIFASDAAGQPAAKVADALRFDSGTTGIKTATALSMSTVYAARTLYWAAAWCYTTAGFPATTNRSGMYVSQPWRLADRPTVQSHWSSPIGGLAESTASWSTLTSAPTTLTPTPLSGTVATTGLYNSSPLIWWGLLNV